MDRQNKIAVVLERVGEGRIMLELAKKKLFAEGCSRTRVRKSGTLCHCSVS